jgi:hypothetical protein
VQIQVSSGPRHRYAPIMGPASPPRA